MRLADVYRRAEVGMRLGSSDYAIELCERVLETFPHDPRTRTLLGQAYLDRGKLDDARRQFEHVLERNPECFSAYGATGVIHTALGNLGAAIRAFERAHDLRPDDPAVGDSLAQLYAQRNGFATRPSAAPPVAVVRWHLKNGEVERALELAGQILVGRPGEVLVLIARVEALWRAGRFADAERACRRLLARHPLFLKPRFILGHLLIVDAPRVVEGVEVLHAALADDAGGTIAAALFAPNPRNVWSVDGLALPILGNELVLPMPDRLANAPFDVDQALEPAVPTDADGDWNPPYGALEPVTVAIREPDVDEDELESVPATDPAISVSTASQRLVLVTRWGPLIARYGADTQTRLQRRLQTIARELSDLDCELLTIGLDDSADLARYGLEPVDDGSPETIKAGLDQVLRAIEGEAREGPSALGVLILGGDEVVPFFRLPNPGDDGDAEVVSDNPYAMRPGDSIYLPSIPLGRFPDGAANNLALLLRQLDSLVDLRRRLVASHAPARLSRVGLAALNALMFGRASSDALVCTTEVAREVAEQVAETMAPNASIRSSPPVTADDFDSRWLANRRLLYFNLHGLADESGWYGHGPTDESDEEAELPRVLHPDLLAAEDLDAPVVFAEVSYAARLDGKTTLDSLALRFLSEGAAAFVGPTGASYGAADRPVVGASLLARQFFRFVRAGHAVGIALGLARREVAATAMEEASFLDGDDQKALLQFVLLGDPLVTSCVAEAELPADRIDAPSALPALCNRVAVAPARFSEKARRAAMEHLVELAPELADGSIRIVRRAPCRGECGHPGHAAAVDDPAVVTQVLARKQVALGEQNAQLAVHLTVSADGEVVKAVVTR